MVLTNLCNYYMLQLLSVNLHRCFTYTYFTLLIILHINNKDQDYFLYLFSSHFFMPCISSFKECILPLRKNVFDKYFLTVENSINRKRTQESRKTSPKRCTHSSIFLFLLPYQEILPPEEK